MKFDTSRSDGVIGIALLSAGAAYAFAVILMQIIDPVPLEIPSAILLIVAALFFGAGAIALVMNSKAIGDAQVDPSSSMLAQAIFLIAMALVVVAGIFVTL